MLFKRQIVPPTKTDNRVDYKKMKDSFIHYCESPLKLQKQTAYFKKTMQNQRSIKRFLNIGPITH